MLLQPQVPAQLQKVMVLMLQPLLLAVPAGNSMHHMIWHNRTRLPQPQLELVEATQQWLKSWRPVKSGRRSLWSYNNRIVEE